MNDYDFTPQSTLENVVELVLENKRYRMKLPDLATDFIQKKVAEEGQPYEREMLEDIRGRVVPGDLIIDVGAHVGNHTIYLAAVADCQVEAFEPNRDLCDALRTSVELNQLGNQVRIHNLGVGGSAAQATFEASLKENLGAQRLCLGDGDINVIALDSINFCQPVRVLKIDVEGMELDVLRGAQALISRDRPILYIECFTERNFRSVSRWLDDRSYVYWETFNATPTHLFVPVESVTFDQRLARMQLQAVEEGYRRNQLSLDVRQKLKRAYENERASKQKVVELLHDLEQSRSALQAMTQELEQSRNALNALTEERTKLRGQLAILQKDIHSIQRVYQISEQRAEKAEKRLERTKSYISYQTGEAIVQSSQSFSAAISLPARLWHIRKLAKQRRRADQRGSSEKSKTSISRNGLAAPQSRLRNIGRKLKKLFFKSERRKDSFDLPCELADLSDLRVACIFDEFTYHSFSPECDLLQLRPDAWREQVNEFKPNLVFVESAWQGAENSWYKKVSDISGELIALIEWAVGARVPTAFWCKEDPVHFARFLPVARLVDYVFTTDIDCIAKYKDALKHDRVYLLPFAAQPVMHNPIETLPREDAFCFAGSYYPQYPDRQVDFRALVTAGRKLKSVAIYDRNADRPQPHDFNFPDEYRSEIRGSLPYTEMDRAYKGYRYGITVNTIKQSQTTFARRAFELMACNTIVVSNFSKGLRLFFGDLVVSSDSTVELEHRLAPLCGDESLYRRHRLLALRSVLSQHTYKHRLAYVASKVSGRMIEAGLPRICMFGEPIGDNETNRLLEAFARQTLSHVELVLVGEPPQASVGWPGVRWFADRSALLTQLNDYDYVAPICAPDYHGPDYLKDLILATHFAQGDGVTKAAYFTATTNGTVILSGGGMQYKMVAQAALRCSLLRSSALKRVLSDDAALRLDTGTITSESILSLDEFSYCRDATLVDTFESTAVDVAPMVRTGVDFVGTLLRISEGIKVSEDIPAGDGPLVFTAPQLHKLFPKELDSRLDVTHDVDGQLVLRSTLGAAEHQYIYLARRFSRSDLKAGQESFFQIEAKARLDLRTVFVFHNAEDKKISYVMHTVGARYSLQVPEGTASARLALRIQGAGFATIGKLTLGELRDLPLQVVPSTPHLIVSNQYPSYADLYRYGFVHARARAYLRAGVPVEVLRLSGDPKVTFREFEDIDVVEADHARFEQCLSEGTFESVLIHIIDQRMWNVVQAHLDRVHVVIWAHGAEIQPWWRRAINFETDALRDQARRTSDARMDMWRKILCLNHPNLHIVFISRKQVSEALSDLGINPKDASGVKVISNFIDSELFSYAKKDAAQRHRILSIRPFASHVYANDLSVEAIRQLSGETFFKNLHFKIVGDGVLFEETVAPIRDLANVEIIRAFLTQRQIAALHRDYGVFLTPSRMDSQGVSRDEAMASGLVPVTTRIAAIPEFVDEKCAFLAEPENAAGLAQGIRHLHENPALFETMSSAAAQRVRKQSGYSQTIGRELELIRPHTSANRVGSVLEELAADEAACTRVALYGDVNLNIMDGSAIWAASLAETLGGIKGLRVSLLLKARIHRTQVIARLLDMAPAVQIVEPNVDEKALLKPSEATAELVALDAQHRFRAFILRGLDLCATAVRTPELKGRIWTYLTDIPQRVDQMDEDTHVRISEVVTSSKLILCQTPQMQKYFIEVFPQAQGKTLILPPMIPPVSARMPSTLPVTPFRVCYAGKFAPLWGIAEMFEVFDALRAQHPSAELHVFGDKVHNPTNQPEFYPMVTQKLSSTNGLIWHGAVDRDELMRQLSTMHVAWAFRDPAFEREIHEMSTKALEYASLGIPIILAKSPVNEAVFGCDYKLFVDTADEALRLLQRLAVDSDFRSEATMMLANVAKHYTFDAVRAEIIAQAALF